MLAQKVYFLKCVGLFHAFNEAANPGFVCDVACDMSLQNFPPHIIHMGPVCQVI